MSNRRQARERTSLAPGQSAEHIVVGEHFVNSRVHTIVQAIHDYEPLIEVQYLPPGARFNENGDELPAYKIVYHDPNAPIPMILFHVKDEDTFDERVLMRIIQNDQRHGKLEISELEAFEQAQKRVKHQLWMDGLEEAEDMVKHIIKTHLNTYKVSDELVVKEGIPFNALRLKD